MLTTCSFLGLVLVPFGTLRQQALAAPVTSPAGGGGAALLAAPSELSALPCGHDVELRWRDNSGQETGFAVLRRAPGAAGFVEIGATGQNETSFTDSDVPDGAYRYRVLARASTGPDSPTSRAVHVTFPNQPPVITTDLPATLDALSGESLRFHVTVTDPEGDPVDLALLNPPFGMICEPLRGAASPATVEGRWRPNDPAENHERLQFASGCARLTVDVRLVNPFGGARRGPRPLLGDVTGDGVPDAVVWNQNPVHEARSPIGVYAGGPTGGTSVAVLDVAGDPLTPRGGYDNWQVVQLEDVTGDGVLDVVSGALSGKVYVWAGGASLSGTPAPRATLVPSEPSGFGANLLLGQFVQLVDVDRDGVLDVVSADTATSLGATEVGAISFWLGGSGLVGTVAPTRTLSVPGAPAHAQLGRGTGVRVVDLTGDGVLDFLAGEQVAERVGLFVWSGAAVLGGASAPTIELVSSAAPMIPGSPLLADLTGDGVVDVIASDYDADFGGVSSVGLVLLWNLVGASATLEPATTFYVPGAAPGDDLGIGIPRLADVTGDGLVDLVVPAPYASREGRPSVGAIYVWRGSVASGTLAPDATLSVPGAAAFDRLDGFPKIDDWDQDGILDVIATDVEADVGGVHDAGAVYLWRGGALSGDVAPSAALVSAAPASGDLLGSGEAPLTLADMDGDGALDVLCESYLADVNGVHDTGVVCLWSGASLAGTVAATATLAPTVAGARLTSFVGFQVADLDGDGRQDVLAGGENGKLYAWRGVPWEGTLAPTAQLSGAPEIGQATGGAGITLADLDGDGRLDVLAVTPSASIGANNAAGALLLWHGRAWVGSVLPDAMLVAGVAHPFEALGSFPDLPRIADLDGDGRLDVFGGSREVESSVPGRYGATYLWGAAGDALGTTSETAKLAP